MAKFDIPTVDPIIAGDYERIKFELVEAKENESDPDVPQNIAGWRLRFGAKFDLSDATYVETKDSSVPGDFEIVDSASGSGYIIFGPNDFTNITYETTLICDLVGEDVSGKPFTTKFYLPVEMGVTD